MRQINDTDLGIEELMVKCFNNAQRHGWHDKPIPYSDAISLLHSEISEAYEEYREHKGYNEIYYNDTNPKPEGIPVELADLTIRLFHYAQYFGVDLTNAIKIKMAYNETRPYRHGGKKT